MSDRHQVPNPRPKHASPAAHAWWDWLESDEGNESMRDDRPTQPYLGNRLQRAFQAGLDAGRNAAPLQEPTTMRFTLAVDFDGTMVRHQFPEIGEPVEGAVEWLRRFQSKGVRLILWTCRTGKPLDEAVAYMKENGIVLTGINSDPECKGIGGYAPGPKVFANRYIDDAAIGVPLNPKTRTVDWNRAGPLIESEIDEMIHEEERLRQAMARFNLKAAEYRTAS